MPWKQQERFDHFVDIYNRERPHEALNQQPPATVYQPSGRRYPDQPPQPEYPLHDDTRPSLAPATSTYGVAQTTSISQRLSRANAWVCARSVPVSGW